MSQIAFEAINDQISPVERVHRRETDVLAILEWARNLSLSIEPSTQWLTFDTSEDRELAASSAGIHIANLSPSSSDPMSEGRSAGDLAADQSIGLLVLTGSSTDELAARVLICILASSNAGGVAPAFRPELISDDEWSALVGQIRDRAKTLHALRGEYFDLLDALKSPSLSTMVGIILQSAMRRTPVLLDGVAAHAAALLAQRVAFRAAGWCASIGSITDSATTRARERLDITGLDSPIDGVRGTAISLAHFLTALKVATD